MAGASIELGLEFRGRRYDSAAAGLEAFGRAINADWQRCIPVLKRELEAYLKGVHASLAKDHASPWPGSVKSPLKNLATRTGKALQSIEQSIKVTGETIGTMEGRIGGLFYLKIQETGGTLRPRGAQYLTVPLPAALDSSGMPLKKSAREWDKTFVMRSKTGNLIVARRNGKDITPLYLLVRQVVIPPRLGLRTRLETGKQYFIERTMKAMLEEMRGG
jgi:hypothetical protein